MNLKRTLLMIKSNFSSIANTYRDGNKLSKGGKKKIGTILLYILLFVYFIFVEYQFIEKLVNTVSIDIILKNTAQMAPLFVAFMVMTSVFFMEFLRIISMNKLVFIRSFPITKKERYVIDLINIIMTSIKFPLLLFVTGGIMFNILTGFNHLGVILSLIYITVIIGIIVAIPTIIIVKLIYMLIGKFTTRKVIEKAITFISFAIGLGIYLLFTTFSEQITDIVIKFSTGNMNILGQFRKYNNRK